MKSVKIITKHSAYNYGAMLQAYALEKTLTTLGAEAKLIDLRQPKPKTRWSYRSPRGIISNLAFRLHRKELLTAYKRFEEFISEYEKTERYDSFWQLKENPPKADVFIAGSDQVWNPLKVDEASFLRFVPDDKIKATYGASLGISYIPKGTKNLLREYIEDFDYISLREKNGKDLLEEITDKNIEVNIDPTLLLNKEDWERVARPVKIKKPYILCYILYRPEWLNDWLKKLKKQTKRKIILVSTEAFRNVYNDKTIRSAGPKEFLGLIKGADFVVSSSFHGVALSIANEKPFYAVVNPGMPSRVSNLLETLDLTDRIVDKNSLPELKDLSYDKTNSILERERTRSINYLKELITNPKKLEKKVEEKKELLVGDVSKVGDLCTACSVCKNVCRKGAITLLENKEGFSYPVIDREKCDNCGACLRKCHAVKFKKNTKETCSAYYGWIKDEKIRLDSSSGGVFTALSNMVLEGGGVVLGAYFDSESKRVVHGSSDEIGLEKFRKSKYAESNIGDSISLIDKALKNNRKVLFCGTPCQCSGIRERFGFKDNLIVVDFLCHGVPSGKVFKEYLEQEERKNRKEISDYRFRTKDFGWSNYGVNLEFKKGKTIKSVSRCNWFYQASMVSNLFLRKSCYTCSKNVVHDADITIGDFWGIANYKSAINDQKGISVLLVNNEKGKSLLENLKTDCELFDLEKQYVEYALKAKTADKTIKTRDWHYKEYFNLGIDKYSKKYFGRRVRLAKLAFALKKRKFKKAVKR